MQTFPLSTPKGQNLIDITEEVKKIVSKSNVKEGLCNVFVPHSSAGVILNENWDASVAKDLLKVLNKNIPLHDEYEHDSNDNNAHSHIKAAWIGSSITIPISEGKLALGQWQNIMFCEFDGPREREVRVQIV